MICLTALLSFLLANLAQASPLTVPIHFFEALDPKDTTSSERFQKEYDSAVKTAKALAAPRLKKCGYEIEEKIVFYGASDALEAHERGEASEKLNAWMIVGPRRSNHYVLLAKGAPHTPSVSTMASSQEAANLGPLHLSIAPSNQEMARAAVAEVKRSKSNESKLTYATLVSEDCVSCVDFSAHFDEASKKAGFKKITEFKFQGDVPDLSEALESLARLKPEVVLIPNYSKVSAQVIASVHKRLPNTFFVGGDGWGDARFGFVQTASDMIGTRGLTVRGFPATEPGLKAFKLEQELAYSIDPKLTKPGSATALAILKILDGTTDLLCKTRPKTALEFRSAFQKSGKVYFRSPWGVSVYHLKDGNISFGKIAKSAR